MGNIDLLTLALTTLSFRRLISILKQLVLSSHLSEKDQTGIKDPSQWPILNCICCRYFSLSYSLPSLLSLYRKVNQNLEPSPNLEPNLKQELILSQKTQHHLLHSLHTFCCINFLSRLTTWFISDCTQLI